MKEELKFSHHPRPVVTDLMSRTFNLRRKEIDDMSGNLAQILQDWPRLTDTEGTVR